VHCGIWNYYHRLPIVLMAGDPAGTPWTIANATLPTTPAWQHTNNNAANSILLFSGAPEESVVATFDQHAAGAGNQNTVGLFNAMGVNQATPGGSGATPVIGQYWVSAGGATGVNINSSFVVHAGLVMAPALGLNTLYSLEAGNSAGTPGMDIYGGVQNCMMVARYNG
jgi:hypothetical protein